MHDHLRDLGRAIVADESRDPSKRSRLWKAEEAYQVFHHESGFESVQSVSLLGLKRSSTVLAGNSASAKNLQLLWLGDNTIQGDLQPLTSNLRWLSWNSCSLRFLPAQWNMEHLVILDLSSSNRFSSPLTRIWNEESGDKHPKNLSVLLLRRCRLLQTLPDLSNYTRLLRVDLEDCSGLTEIPQSIELLVHLKWLNLWGCEGLEGLPESISKLSSLEKFYVNDCSSITTLPKTLGELTALKELHLRGLVQIEHLPPFQTGCCLQRLVLSGCRTLRNLHPSIGDLKQLTYLEMNKCSTISQLPQEFGNLESLKKLLLNECSRLRELPETFGNLRNLVALELKNTLCSKLPENFCNLESLVHFDASFSHLAFLPEAIDKLSSLEILNLQGTFIEGLPETVKQLGKLKTLVLNQCNKLTLLPTLPEALVNLEAHKCNVIKELPLLSSLESLAKLDIRGSINIKNIAGLGLGSLKSLQCLYLSGSDSIGFNLTRVVKAMQLFWWSITEKTEDQTLDSESSKDIVSFSVVSNSRCAGLLLLFEMEFDPKGAMQIGFVIDEEQSIEGPTVDIEGGEQFILIFRATHPLVVALEKARNLCVRAKGNGIRIRFVEIYVGIEIEDTRFNLKNRYWRSNIFNPYLTIGGMPFAHRRGYNLIYKSVLVSPDDTSGLLVPSLCTNIANIATREPRLLRQRGNTLVGSDRHFHHSTTKMMVSPHCHSLISFHNRGNSLT